jgi:hypothetical protein
MYKRVPGESEFDVDLANFGGHERHARRDCAEQFVANRARRGSDVIDRQSFTPEHDGTADARLRHLGEIDRHQVHRNAARRAHFLAAHQNRSAIGCVARVAVGVSAGNHPDPVRARGGVVPAVTHAGVGLEVVHRDQLAAQGHRRRQAQGVRAIVRKRR